MLTPPMGHGHRCSTGVVVGHPTGGADGEINLWSLTDLKRVRWARPPAWRDRRPECARSREPQWAWWRAVHEQAQAPARRSNKLTDITAVAFNRQLSHILATSSSNGTGPAQAS